MKGRKLPKKATLGLIIGGDLLLLLAGWFMLIGPQRATAASIAQATSAAQAQLVEARRPVVPVKPAPAPKQPVIQTADLYTLATAMPSSIDQPGVMLELDQVARSAGVDLTSISFDAETIGTPFSTMPVNLAFTGDFYSITDMLYRLRTLVSVRNGTLQTSGRLFAINSVGLAPASIGSGLNATVIVDAYVYGDAPAAAPVVVAPVGTDTTGTDTTSTGTTPAP